MLIAESAADGLVLRGDQGTRMSDVRAEHNGGNGVLVTGPSTDRPITGIATTGNAAFGVALSGQTASRVTESPPTPTAPAACSCPPART